MTLKTKSWATLVMLVTASGAALGQSPATAPAAMAETPLVLETIAPPNKNKVSLAYRIGLNLTVDFKKLGGFAAQTDPGPDVGAVEDRAYDDGYNRVDSSGNAGGLTWYWGYEDAGAVQGDSLVFNSSSSPTNGVSKDNDDGVNHGFEIVYSRELYRAEKYRAGVDAAFGWTGLEVEDRREVRTAVSRITDTFAVPGGVFVLPAAPYAGTFEGPGPLISSDLAAGQRQRTSIAKAATITGERNLDTSIFLFRLGPYIEFPLGQREKFSLGLNAGVNLVLGNMDFKYNETVTIEEVGSVSRSASGSKTDFLVGVYAGAQLSYAIDENWSVFAGAQFQSSGEAVTKKGGKQAVLDMAQAISVTIGVGYSF